MVSAMSYLRAENLRIRVYQDACVLPFDGSKTPCGGGVVCIDQMYVKDSTLFEWDSPLAYPLKRKCLEKRQCCAVYIGVMVPIFGHCITDNLKKLWFLQTEEGKRLIREDYDIVYITYWGQHLKPWGYDVLQSAGVDVSRLKEITKPTLYKRIYIPDNAIISKEIKKNVGEKYYTKEFKWVVDSILRYSSECVLSVSYNKIYLSRTAYRSKRDFGEKRIERLFKKAGYEIIFPERHSFVEQVSIISHAEEIVTTEGSISHLAMFAKYGTKMLLLKKIDWMNPYQEFINEMAGLNVRYVNSNHSIKVECGWEGPFYMSPTRELCGFLNIEANDRYMLRLDYYVYLLYFCWCHFPVFKGGRFLAKKIIVSIKSYLEKRMIYQNDTWLHLINAQTMR